MNSEEGGSSFYELVEQSLALVERSAEHTRKEIAAIQQQIGLLHGQVAAAVSEGTAVAPRYGFYKKSDKREEPLSSVAVGPLVSLLRTSAAPVLESTAKRTADSPKKSYGFYKRPNQPRVVSFNEPVESEGLEFYDWVSGSLS